MNEKEYGRLNKKRQLKESSGIDATKEVAAQTSMIMDEYDKLREEGFFDEIDKEKNICFCKYLEDRNIVCWKEPYQQIKQLIPALIADFEKREYALPSIKNVNAALSHLASVISIYCDGCVEKKMSNTPVYDFSYEPTEENYEEYLDKFYNDAYNVLNSALQCFAKNDKEHLAFLASLMMEIYFFLGMITNNMEYGF